MLVAVSFPSWISHRRSGRGSCSAIRNPPQSVEEFLEISLDCRRFWPIQPSETVSCPSRFTTARHPPGHGGATGGFFLLSFVFFLFPRASVTDSVTVTPHLVTGSVT